VLFARFSIAIVRATLIALTVRTALIVPIARTSKRWRYDLIQSKTARTHRTARFFCFYSMFS
jgi:hypothetical protein